MSISSDPAPVPVNSYSIERVFIMAQNNSDGCQRLYIYDRDTAAVRLSVITAALSNNNITAAAAEAAD